MNDANAQPPSHSSHQPVQSPQGAEAPPVMAPPIRPGPLARGRQPAKWPVILGIFAIVLGALGIIARGASLVFTMFFGTILAGLEEIDSAATGQLADQWIAWTIAENAMGLILAIVLLIAGIGLVQRSRPSFRMLLVWAWIKIAFVLGEALLAFYIQRDHLQATGTPGLDLFAVIFGVVPVLFIGLAFPIICISILSLRSSRNEVASWR